MNSNTNAIPNTFSTTSGSGSGMGTRFRGAAEVVHGAGEALRGTFLGAVDTVTRNGSPQNDEIARQGRLEVERGMAKMKGQSTVGTTTAYGHGTSASASAVNSNTAYNAPHATSASGATHMPGAGAGAGLGTDPSGGGVLHPNHHREDAVGGIPQAELRDVKSQSQSYAPQSYSQTQEHHGWHGTNAYGDGVNPTTATHGGGFANGNNATANANADYATGTGTGGTYTNSYGPAGDGDQNQNPSEYSQEAYETAVGKGKLNATANGGLAHDQGPVGRGMETRGLDGRSGLN